MKYLATSIFHLICDLTLCLELFINCIYLPEGHYITCFEVITYTHGWGHEMSWYIKGTTSSISCNNNQEYDDYRMYMQECCMPTTDNEFSVTCIDSFGDGWRPGDHLEVDGRQVCGDFVIGYNYTTVIPNPIKRDCGAGRKLFKIKPREIYNING